MSAPIKEVLDLLDLEAIEVNIFRGTSPSDRWQRVFGGQVLGQALVAASRTVDDRIAHSLHAYFIRPGDPRVADVVTAAIARYQSRGTPIRAVMLDRLGPNVWEETPAKAMAVLEELEETAKLWLFAGKTTPTLKEDEIDELRRDFGARW